MYRLTLTILCCFLSFNTYASPRLLVEPNAGIAPILSAIHQAKQHIDIEMYLFTDQRIVNALIAAHKRDINVRVILEHHPYYQPKANVTTIKRLKKSGIPVHWANSGISANHQKLMLIDTSQAWLMTFNYVKSSFSKQLAIALRNFVVINDNKQLNQILAKDFEAEWNAKPTLAQHNKTLIWTPNSSRYTLEQLISSANEKLDLYISFELSDPSVIKQLLAATKRGVDIRILISLRDPIRQTLRALNDLQQAGAKIKVLQKPKNHAKVVFRDPGYTEQRAYLGSANMTRASLDCNRELGMLLTEKNILHQLATQFDKDWQHANLYHHHKLAGAKDPFYLHAKHYQCMRRQI